VNSEDQILNNQEDKDSEKSLPQTEKTLDINLKFIIC
jgi:hypothetical protein